MGANLDEACLDGANLARADMTRIRARGVSIGPMERHDANGKPVGATWPASLIAARLAEADLSGANLRSANLTGADLTRANLRGAILIDARVAFAKFERANLTLAQLPPNFV